MYYHKGLSFQFQKTLRYGDVHMLGNGSEMSTRPNHSLVKVDKYEYVFDDS